MEFIISSSVQKNKTYEKAYKEIEDDENEDDEYDDDGEFEDLE